MSDETNMKDIDIEEIPKEVLIASTSQEDISKIIEWVNQIKDESLKEQALSELSRKRESFADLALYIWYSNGIVALL